MTDLDNQADTPCKTRASIFPYRPVHDIAKSMGVSVLIYSPLVLFIKRLYRCDTAQWTRLMRSYRISSFPS